jgi:GNAT superfamily N-acetyltransferase
VLDLAQRLLTATAHRLWPSLPDVTRNALVDEHVAALTEANASPWSISCVRGRELLLVHDRRRAWVLAWAEASGRVEEGWALPWPVEWVLVGGPPGAYLASGVREDDRDERAWFEREGFVVRARHVDLRVTLAAPIEPPTNIRRATREEFPALGEWIARTFAPAWSREAHRSLFAHDALFIAGTTEHYLGFSAHSGHNAALGTFGPIGVSPDARGSGLGRTLARAALDDLHARGFREAIIPWVDPAIVDFYRPLTQTLESASVLTLAR